MKRTIIIAVILLFAGFQSFAQKDRFDRIFEQYQEAEGVTSIKVNKAMFSMLNNLDLGAELQEMKPLLERIQSIQILITEDLNLPDSIKPTAQQLAFAERNKQIRNQINGAVQGLSLEELVSVNSKGNRIKLATSQLRNDVMDNLIITVTSTDKNILMFLDGELRMSEVSQFINKVQK